ncbi:MAG: 4Fe-4S dicluster domain-containing protein [Burkholderiales bacterium]|jgi:Fe-S-cluster-containing dehydrogenase component|nr:4Fe-4S dicluster domain-containing protein [Burkholderiales bacterium]
MTRYAMAIDTRLCVGCNDCVVACQTENDVPPGYFRNWITTEVRGAFPTPALEIRSERCNHCENPPCVHACPTGASHVSDLGAIVMVDRDKCIGCKACVVACPYGARYIHPDGYADKCTFCAHRVREGKDPACSPCARRTRWSSAISTTRRARCATSSPRAVGTPCCPKPVPGRGCSI